MFIKSLDEVIRANILYIEGGYGPNGSHYYRHEFMLDPKMSLRDMYADLRSVAGLEFTDEKYDHKRLYFGGHVKTLFEWINSTAQDTNAPVKYLSKDLRKIVYRINYSGYFKPSQKILVREHSQTHSGHVKPIDHNDILISHPLLK